MSEFQFVARRVGRENVVVCCLGFGFSMEEVKKDAFREEEVKEDS